MAARVRKPRKLPIGTRVKIKGVVDPENFTGEFYEEGNVMDQIGKKGWVIGYIDDDHGATPEDPAYTIGLDGGDKDMFFRDELTIVWAG